MDDYRLASILTIFLVIAFSEQSNANSAYSLHLLDDGMGSRHGQATGISNNGGIIGVVLDFPNNQVDHILWQNRSPEVIAVGISDTGQPLAINDAGMIVGSIVTGTYNEPATWSGTSYIWNNGTLTLLPPSGVDGGFGIWGLNNHGVMAGFSNGPTAALWDGTAVTTLPGIGGLYSWATAINDAGVVAGNVQLQPDRAEMRGFVYQNGTVTRLGSLGGTTEIVSGINQAGTIIGFSLDTANQPHAAMWLNGMIHELPTDDIDLSGAASGINNAGDIVGTLNGPSNAHPFAALWSNGELIDLNSALGGNAEGFHLEAATGINDLGQIVGYGSYDNGITTQAFLLTPEGAGVVPEPMAGALAGMAAIGTVLRRRRRHPVHAA